MAAGVAHKSLVPVAGMPMAWHVVQALGECERVGEIVVVGIEPREIEFGVAVHHVPNQPSLWASQNAGLRKLQELNAEDRYVLALSADSALLTGEIIDRFIDACAPLTLEAYWGIIRKEVMVAAFPQSKRTYLPLREGSFCSSDLYLGRVSAGLRIQERIRYFYRTSQECGGTGVEAGSAHTVQVSDAQTDDRRHCRFRLQVCGAAGQTGGISDGGGGHGH